MGRHDNNGYVQSNDKCVRVSWYIKQHESAYGNNWTFGDYIALDEYSENGARSRFCSIGMYNPSKPGPAHHLDFIVMADAGHNYPRFVHVFQKTGKSMADIVFDHCRDGAWNNKEKIIVTDSRYAQMSFFKAAHVRGASAVSTVKIPGDKGKAKAQTDRGDKSSKCFHSRRCQSTWKN